MVCNHKGWTIRGVLGGMFFLFFFWWLKDRVRVQKVMYCQQVKVDYKGQWTQKKKTAKKDVGRFFFSSLKSLRGRGKVPLSKEKRNEDICSFWVSTKAQLIVVHSPLQEIKFASDLKNFPPLTFQVEVLQPGRRGFVLCSPTQLVWEPHRFPDEVEAL